MHIGFRYSLIIGTSLLSCITTLHYNSPIRVTCYDDRTGKWCLSYIMTRREYNKRKQELDSMNCHKE